MIITIDGSVATGKSTVAKKLAEELGYIYFDTGAMYRGITWLALQKKTNIDDPVALVELLKDFVFEIKIKRGDRHYIVNKEDITQAIREEAVTGLVSKVSALAPVREKLVALQREFVLGVNAVFDGRDMGTVVFPLADLKIFLIAKPEVRAQRRFEELKVQFPEEAARLTLEKVLEDINRRDTLDSTREISPLRQAEDAFLLDTSDLTIDDVVMRILEFKDEKRSHTKKH